MNNLRREFNNLEIQVTEVQADEDIRLAYSNLLTVIEAMTPACRERSIAITDLQTSAMWARRALVAPNGERR